MGFQTGAIAPEFKAPYHGAPILWRSDFAASDIEALDALGSTQQRSQRGCVMMAGHPRPPSGV